MPAVTWIMPILNGMPFLPETLESIRAQTFKDHQVLVWDNGSTDGTLEVLNEWIPHRLPGRVITGTPLSLGLSLRALVEASDTPYCIRVDADDISLPPRLQRQFDHLEKHRDLAIVSTDCLRIGEDGLPVYGHPWYPFGFTDILHGLLVSSSYSHPCCMFRREAVLEVGNYRDLSTAAAGYWPEDYDLWMRLFSRHKGEMLHDRLVLYRHQNNSLSARERKADRNPQGRLRVFVENARVFAGIEDSGTARRLRAREMPFALPVLQKIARHLTSRDGMAAAARWRSPSFLRSAGFLLSPKDIATRAWVRLLRSKFA